MFETRVRAHWGSECLHARVSTLCACTYLSEDTLRDARTYVCEGAMHICSTRAFACTHVSVAHGAVRADAACACSMCARPFKREPCFAELALCSVQC